MRRHGATRMVTRKMTDFVGGPPRMSVWSVGNAAPTTARGESAGSRAFRRHAKLTASVGAVILAIGAYGVATGPRREDARSGDGHGDRSPATTARVATVPPSHTPGGTTSDSAEDVYTTRCCGCRLASTRSTTRGRTPGRRSSAPSAAMRNGDGGNGRVSSCWFTPRPRTRARGASLRGRRARRRRRAAGDRPRRASARTGRRAGRSRGPHTCRPTPGTGSPPG